MFVFYFASLFVAACLIKQSDAECANACNGHGKCTSYDMCICNRNWQANDCSERVCQFGLAHVDTPKGDLDMDGVVTSPPNIVADNSFVYPYGTTEQFPLMEDSDLNVLTDSAHYYMECSNKGTCDRSSGECTCYDGYDGAACQRASCPGYPSSCSGHGVCKTIEQLAALDYGNQYALWDRKSTMGCYCDAGYYGPDCSLKRCKYGIDPLYLDDTATVKFSIFDFAVLTTDQTALGASIPIFTDGLTAAGQGTFAIRFFDAYGEDWVTQPIVAGANCKTVIAALEALPNDVIPPGQTWCTRVTETVSGKPLAGAGSSADWNGQFDAQYSTGTHAKKIVYNAAFWETMPGVSSNPTSLTDPAGVSASASGFPSSYDVASLVPVQGYIYRLKFFGNPGALKQPQIEIYLDGQRPSLATTGASFGAGLPNQVITKVWTDGQQGESNDYFADHCDNVVVTIGTDTSSKISYLQMVSSSMTTLLKSCLGASDFDSSNNVIADVYNWDYGSVNFPHLIKLVRSSTTYTDGGYYVALIYYASGTVLNGAGNGASVNLYTLASDSFVLLNPFYPPDSLPTDQYDVYTTTGTLALTSNFTEAIFGFASQEIILTAAGLTEGTYKTVAQSNFDLDATHGALGASRSTAKFTYSGGVSCETEYNMKYRGSLTGDFNYETSYIAYCLNKTDIFVLLNTDDLYANPPHINLYTAQRLYNKHYDYSISEIWGSGSAVVEASLGTHVIVSDLSINWASSLKGTVTTGGTAQQFHPRFRVYKFFPSKTSTYNLVAECSNRGICATDTGICQCFPGYSSDSCSQQNSLAV